RLESGSKDREKCAASTLCFRLGLLSTKFNLLSETRNVGNNGALQSRMSHAYMLLRSCCALFYCVDIDIASRRISGFISPVPPATWLFKAELFVLGETRNSSVVRAW